MSEPAVDPRITWAVAQMQTGLARPIAIADLAVQVNLSPSRFRQLFGAQTGHSPARYLQQLRLRRARLLLERTFLSVKEVMTLVGYNDPSHFARDFRRLHGMPPSAARAPGLVATIHAGGANAAVSAETAVPSNAPSHRRIGQARTRDPSARCA